MNWFLSGGAARWVRPPIRHAVLCTITLVVIMLVGLHTTVAHAQSTPSQLQDLSGRLQQQILNDPVLTPRPQPEVRAPETPKTPAPQPLDDAGPKVTIQSFVISGNERVLTEDIQALLRPWTQTPISLTELRRGVAQVAALYRVQGFLAQAVLPNQDITDGTVQIQVVEGKVGKIIVQAPPDQQQIGGLVRERVQHLLDHRMPAGQALRFADYDWAILVADDLPGVSVEASLQAGQELGTTDVVVQVAPTRMVRGLVSTDNNGSRTTGPLRVNALLQVESALGWGESFNLSASKTEGSRFFRLAHSIPLGFEGWRGLTLNLNASVFDYRVLNALKGDAPVSPEGLSKSRGLSVRYPFVRSRQTTLSGEWGYENRESTDKQGGILLDPNQLAISRQTRIEASNLTLTLTHNDSWGGGGSNLLTSTLTHGKLGLLPESALEREERFNSVGSFRKLRVVANRLQLLDAKHSALMSFTGQIADRNLDASEKLFLGGSSSIRAFPNSEVGGSEGVVASFELRRDWTTKWQSSFFYDYGRVNQYKYNFDATNPGTKLIETPNAQVLKGQGFGLTYRRPNGAEFRAQVSRRLHKNPMATEAGTDRDGSLRMNRWWFSASMPF